MSAPIDYRQGATRFVLLIGRYAVKVPLARSWRTFLNGLLANMQERMFAQTGWPELCPILFSLPGGWLVVMPRVAVLTPKEFQDFNYEKFVECGGYHVPVEEKYNSFGKFNGRVVAIDYGT